MIYQFGPFELDLATVELRAGGEACSLEPQVFALLALLIENRDRLVSAKFEKRPETLSVSVMTAAELRFGAEKAGRRGTIAVGAQK